MSYLINKVDISVTGAELILDDIFKIEDGIENVNEGLARELAMECAKTATRNWKATHLEDIYGTPFKKEVSAVSVTKDGDGFLIGVSGKDVAFLEFGAGVHYNGSERYPGERPPEICNIGEFGKGKGKQDQWSFLEEKWETTYGNKAFAPMYRAARTTEKKIYKIARKMFG